MKHKFFWILLFMSSCSGVVLSDDKGENDETWIKEQVEQFKEIKPYLLETEKPTLIKEPLSNTQKTFQPDVQPNTQSPVQIFISFSMPVESLKAWSRQAKTVHGTLVLRGLVENSLKK